MAYEFPTTAWPIESGDHSAQSTLNRLKEHTSAVNMSWWLINRIWDEDSTGALSYAPQNDDSLKVVSVESGGTALKVKVLLGAGFLAGVPFRKLSDTTIADDIEAPTTLPRIDSVGVNPSTGAVTIYTGEEHASPTAAAVPTGIFKACEIYCRPGMTHIYDNEQSTGGYIQNQRALFALPGDEPHTSGLTISGGALIHDGSAGDVTIPADGLSIEFDYAGEVNIDATNAAGHLIFRTGGSTDRLSLGIPSEPIILHGSSHDLILSHNGRNLKSSGPSMFSIEQDGGDGISLVTDETTRYLLDTDGDHHFIGSLGEVAVRASGNRIDMTRDGANEIRAVEAAATLGLYAMGGATPHLLLAANINLLGTNLLYEFYRASATLDVSGANTSNFTINRAGGSYGIMLQTDGDDRYQVDADGRHDFWGDVYFNNDVYILGTLYIDGVAFTGDGGGDTTGYATITLPGTVFEPASSGGSGGADYAEFGSNVLMFQTFENSADGYCMAPNILMPLNFNDSQAVHVRVRWSANDTSTNQVRFQLQTAPQGDGAAANETLNAATTILDLNESVANEMHVTPWTTINVTNIEAGDAMAIRLDRTPTHADDTLAATVRVHSVDIRYTRGSTA